MKLGDKLYLITHEGLSVGQSFAQLIHVFREFINDYPDVEREWFSVSNYIVVLRVKSSKELESLLQHATLNNVKTSQFYEPDFNNELTAIAIEPGKNSERLCKGIPLLC